MLVCEYFFSVRLTWTPQSQTEASPHHRSALQLKQYFLRSLPCCSLLLSYWCQELICFRGVRQWRMKGIENLQLVNPALRSACNLNCHHIRWNSLKSMLLILWTLFFLRWYSANNLLPLICFRNIVWGSVGTKTYQILWKYLCAALSGVSLRAVLWRLIMQRCSFSSRCCMTSA